MIVGRGQHARHRGMYVIPQLNQLGMRLPLEECLHSALYASVPKLFLRHGFCGHIRP